MLKDPETATLGELVGLAWDLLDDGVNRRTAPFHTPVLASMAEHGADARTVVLRAADAPTRQVICHTDTRSPKVAQLADNPGVTWVFYDPKLKIQLRLRGPVTLYDNDELATRRWDASTPSSRLCYANSPGPGAKIEQPESVSVLDEQHAYQNFQVLSCQVEHLDWLFLSSNCHRRAHCSWRDGSWQANWLAP
ncbi:MAG: pyridoxamine 5'-phosphate oxidase family protein [Gammaproteobacteria bacterium]